MIPVAYQLPAAIVLIAGGIVACMAGYRLFRIVLAIYGFILGALVASSIPGPGETLPLVLAAIVGGLLGALVLNLAYFAGVALVGAGAGALVLFLVWSHVGQGDPAVILVVVCAAAGAIAATMLQRFVIILATAFGGAWTVLVGALAIAGDKAATAAARASGVWIVYPLSLEPGRKWTVAVWLALGLIGTTVQLRAGAPGPTAHRRANRTRRR
jgi:hypothetical protein